MTTTLATDVELGDDVLALVADRAAASDSSGHLDPEVMRPLPGGRGRGDDALGVSFWDAPAS